MRTILMRVLTLILFSACLAGCGTGGGTNNLTTGTPAASSSGGVDAPTQAQFDPFARSLSTIPIPSDVLLRSATTGFNNLPGVGEPYDSFNSIAGFSTSGHIYVPFVGLVEASSVSSSSVRLIDATPGRLSPTRRPSRASATTACLTSRRCSRSNHRGATWWF
ncbi:MAG: hypothetical protein FJX76_25310 [Armatimonadetes bacterium]|nr:hypothetical protein [Armatimonadota bacterium]